MGLTGPFRLRELLLDRTGQNVTVAVPTGVVYPFAGSTAPTGYLLCDDTPASRRTYAALFAVISTTYGVGDGSNTFGLPDMRGRTAVGAGTGTELTARTRGAQVGAEIHQLNQNEMPAHDHNAYTSYMTQNWSHGHTATTPGGHTLGMNFNGLSGYAVFTLNAAAIHSGIYGGRNLQADPVDINHQHTIATNGANGSHNNMQPSLVLNFIIKT